VETSQALRETSDALLRDLEVLGTLEDEKRELAPGDPRLVELAGRIQEIAERVLAGTVRQHQLTQVVNVQVESGSPGAPTKPIAETPRTLPGVLAAWRDAERRRASAEPGSGEEAEARALAEALRDEYRRAYDAARGAS
jgi:DNA-binding HxlR family transcriptional regulator